MVFAFPTFLTMKRGLVCAASTLALTLFALPAAPLAQDTARQQVPATQQTPDYTGDVPAHIAVIDGKATLERDGTIETAQENAPLLAGDRLKTEDGRVEIMFADGSVLDVDRDSSLDLLSESLLRLRSGRLRLSIVRVTEELNYRIDAVGTTTTIRTAGEYRLSVTSPKSAEPTVDLAVIRGSAELSTDTGRTLVRAGMRAFASEHTEPSLPSAFNSTATTEFDHWCDDQRDQRLGAVSSQYLPSELRYYSGAMDRGGDWQYDSNYGYVWYPNVAATWQPYYYGNWSVVASFGWFWVGGGSWCWPTHHYGWWGWNGARWYWAPGVAWSPAWVSWGYAPGFVSWCPIGFGGHAVVAHGHGWTTVPAHTFTTGVAGFAVPRHVVTAPVTAGITTRTAGPTVATARSRNGQALGSPTGRTMAVARNGDVSRTSNSPRATLRSGPSVSSSGSADRGFSRVPSQQSQSQQSRQFSSRSSPAAPGAAVARSRTPQTPETNGQPPLSRVPGGDVRTRAYSNSRPPSDPPPMSSGSSRVIAPRGPVYSDRAPDAGSGSRRVAPPPMYRGGGESPSPAGPPMSRAVPRGAPSAPPSAGPPPASHSGPPSSTSSGRSSAGSSSHSSGGGGSRGGGRGGR